MEQLLFQYTPHFRDAWLALAQANPYFRGVVDNVALVDENTNCVRSDVRRVAGTERVWEKDIHALHGEEYDGPIFATISYDYYLSFQVTKESPSRTLTCLLRHIGAKPQEPDDLWRA